MKRVLVLKEKHDTWYFDVSTQKQLEDMALSVVTGRFSMRNAPYGLYDEVEEAKTPALTMEEIDTLQKGAIKEAGQREWEEYELQIREDQRHRDAQNRISKCIAEKDGKLAVEILEQRKQYEYEGFEIVEISDKYGNRV